MHDRVHVLFGQQPAGVALGKAFIVLAQRHAVVYPEPFLAHQLNVHAADGVHDGRHPSEVDQRIILNVHFKILVHRFERQLRAAEGVRGIDAVFAHAVGGWAHTYRAPARTA